MANSSFLNTTIVEPSRFRIDTKYFSPDDLALFVDSLETITRMELEKAARKEQQRLHKFKGSKRRFINMPRIGSIKTLNLSTSLKEETEEEMRAEKEEQEVREKQEVKEEPVERVEKEKTEEQMAKKIKRPDSPLSLRTDFDECYFSAPSSNQTSPRSIDSHDQQQLNNKFSSSTFSVLTNSDSEESGVFPTATDTHGNVNETSRSKLNSKTRSIARRSLLLNLIKKREPNNSSAIVLISHRQLDEYETLEMYELEQKQQQELTHQQQSEGMLQSELLHSTEKCSFFSTLSLKRKSRHSVIYTEETQEVRFLDKALRYLTL